MRTNETKRRNRNKMKNERMKVNRMKSGPIVLLLALILGAVSPGWAQSAQTAYTIDRTQHDFGTVEQGKTYRTTFSVTSTGSGPLVLLDAKVNCQCTKIDFPGKPLRKGEKAVVTVTFEAKDAGIFNKTVRMLTNASGRQAAFVLRITGVVKEK